MHHASFLSFLYSVFKDALWICNKHYARINSLRSDLHKAGTPKLEITNRVVALIEKTCPRDSLRCAKHDLYLLCKENIFKINTIK